MLRASYRRFAFYCVIAIALVVPVRLYVAQPFLVAGHSMEPTFAPGDYLVVDELSYRLHAPERGDVVVFGYPLDSDQILIKRIVGLPGETVQVSHGQVTVVGADQHTITVLDEPYRSDASGREGVSRTTLHDDEYYVLGDDRDVSSDSRMWGPVQRRFIIGRAYVRLLPLPRASVLPGAHAFSN